MSQTLSKTTAHQTQADQNEIMSELGEPRSGTRQSLLPSTSLEGLERFVPPERSPFRNYIPQWKLDKPLPHLPLRTSSLYNFDDRNNGAEAKARRYRRSLYGNDPRSKLGTVLDTCSMEDLSIGRPREDRQRGGGGGRSGVYPPVSPLPVTSPLRKHWRAGSDVEAEPVKRARRSPASPHLRGAQSMRSPGLKGNFGTGNGYEKTPRTAKTERPQSRKTNHSVDPTLVPLPLEVEESQQSRNGIQSLPSPAKFENRNVCLCNNPHPCHSEVIPSTPWSDAPEPEFVRPWTASTAATAKPKRSATPIERGEIGSISSRIPKQSVDSGSANRTRLYSFSTSTSVCENPSIHNSNRNSNINTGETSNDTYDHLDVPDLPHPPPTSYSHLPRPPSPFTEPQIPAPSPPRRRTRQLAIPPSDYQQHGPKIWSATKPKRKKSQILPDLIAKLIPKALRSRSSKSQLQQQPAPPLQKAASAQNLMSSRPVTSRGTPADGWGRVGGENKRAWRSTITLGRRISRETFGISRSEKKRREDMKSHIVMVGPTSIQVVDDEVRWV